MEIMKNLYAKDLSLTVEILEELILKREPVFLLFHACSAVAKAAYLHYKFANDKYFESETETHTFFGNSRLEAIACGAKIARHKGRDAYGKNEGLVLIYDPFAELKEFYNPFHTSAEEDLLVPGVEFFEQLDSVEEEIKKREVSGLIIVNHHDIDLEKLTSIRQECKARNIVFVLDEYKYSFDELTSTEYQLKINPDAVLVSENIVKGLIPFGATIMTADTYQPWNSMQTFIAHSNTYGSNKLAMKIFNHLMKTTDWYASVSEEVEDILKAIDSSVDKKIEYLLKCYNPNLTRLQKEMKMHGKINYVYRSTIDFAEENGGTKTVIDCLTNFGLSPRGYNPDDIVEDVLRNHDHEEDYFQKLSSKLVELTGLSAVFPAISGASAVGLGIRLGLMSNKNKPKVIVFTGGYAGKTFVAILGTTKKLYKDPFGPYYSNAIEIDPASETAIEEFEAAIKEGDVGLVWFEVVQAEVGVKPLPEPLLSVIKENRSKAGYLIGVDEFQTGMFRTGTFLSSEKRDLKPDIVVMAKAFTDTVHPMSAVLAKDEVYAEAKENFPDLVRCLEKLYLNQLGAHIALHAVTKSIEWKVADNVAKRGEQLLDGLREVSKPYDFVKEVRGEGLLVGVEFDTEKIPEEMRESVCSIFGQLNLFDEQPVLVFLTFIKNLTTRYEPPLIITKEQVDVIIENTKRSLKKLQEMLNQKTH